MTINANPLGGSDDLDATSLDNPNNWNFYDPELDGEIEEGPEAGIESEAKTEDGEPEEVEAKSIQEDGEDESVEEPEDGQPDAEDEEPEPETFSLPTGESVTRDELISGYMKEADYRRKTSMVAESRRAVEAQAQRMQRQIEVLSEYLVSNLPAEPDASLAYTDPQTYNARKAAYDQQLGNLQKLLAMANEPKEVANEISGQVSKERLTEENARLASAFPMTTNQKGREKFFRSAFDAAGRLGFSDKEMQSVTDSRMFGLAYYANLGMQAEKAREKAKQKVAEAPKAPPKRSRVAVNSDQAMQKLRQSGSIHDAVMVDFE